MSSVELVSRESISFDNPSGLPVDDLTLASCTVFGIFQLTLLKKLMIDFVKYLVGTFWMLVHLDRTLLVRSLGF